MTDLSPERRAELRADCTDILQRGGVSYCLKPTELLALLDATEPVADAEVALVLKWIREIRSRVSFASPAQIERILDDAAALIERQVAEIRRMKG